MVTLNLQALIRELRGKRSEVADRLRVEAEEFWAREAGRQSRQYIQAIQRELERQWERTGTAHDGGLPAGYGALAPAAYALTHCLALGGWQGKRHCEEAAEAAPPSALRERLSPGEVERLNRALGKLTVDEAGQLDIPEWVADQLKFPAAFARTFGIAPEYAALYVAERLPPIVDATDELRARVRDAVGQAAREVWEPEKLRAALQQIGDWSTARTANQVRTEAQTLFVRGRMSSFAGDPMVKAYRFIVTVDNDTTDICRAHIGKVVLAGNLDAIPPFHYQCRTQIVPIFRWELEKFPALATGGDVQPGVMAGFGQKEWLGTAGYRP
jgi:SPP1 gp7 family putative phage head morphogenesis protein